MEKHIPRSQAESGVLVNAGKCKKCTCTRENGDQQSRFSLVVLLYGIRYPSSPSKTFPTHFQQFADLLFHGVYRVSGKPDTFLWSSLLSRGIAIHVSHLRSPHKLLVPCFCSIQRPPFAGGGQLLAQKQKTETMEESMQEMENPGALLISVIGEPTWA